MESSDDPKNIEGSWNTITFNNESSFTCEKVGTTFPSQLPGCSFGLPIRESLQFDPRKGFTILFKADDYAGVEDPWVSALHNAGYRGSAVQTIEFEFINLNILWEELQQPELYQGMVLSSPRVVDAISHLSSTKEKSGMLWNNSAVNWANKPIFCVGPKTSQKIQELFNILVPGKSLDLFIAKDGDIHSLKDHILQVMQKGEKKILIPCGSKTNDDLPNCLASSHLCFKNLVVYKTLDSTKLESAVKDLKASIDENWTKNPQVPYIFMFFSPSGVRAVKNFIKNFKDDCRINLFAIGRRTADELKMVCEPLEVQVFALPYPSPTALISKLLLMSCDAENEHRNAFDTYS